MPRKSKNEQPFDKSKYDIQYMKENYKQIPLKLRFEFYNAVLEHTEKTRETMNGFIKRAIIETMERDDAQEE